MKEIKENINKWKVFMSWKIYTVKMVNVPKLVYRFNSIPIKIPGGFFLFFAKIGKLKLKFTWKSRDPE